MLDTNMTFGDLGLLSVFIVIIVSGVFLIRALVHLGGTLREVKKLVRSNAENIDKVIKDLPALSENAVNLTEIASDVADNLRNEQEIIDTALENISDTIESVSDTARSINEDFLGGIRRLVNILTTAIGLITKKKPQNNPETVGGGNDPAETGGPAYGDTDMDTLKIAKRERRKKKAPMRNAAVAARKRQAARNININIR